jgi:hypothetical protein
MLGAVAPTHTVEKKQKSCKLQITAQDLLGAGKRVELSRVQKLDEILYPAGNRIIFLQGCPGPVRLQVRLGILSQLFQRNF